ncbi:MAG TPA: ATP-dependent DNA helicase RecG [Acidobacteriaceae bacterium]|nr:ATP-dependent DNA helicase RecG [Acidobacteriaceae bacterium]
MTLDLDTPVKYVKRIGERIAAGLHERGIETVEDLLYHLPFRYEDRLHPRPLSTYQPGEMASILGEVRGAVLLRTRSSPIFEMTVGVTPAVPTISSNAVILSGAPERAEGESNGAQSKDPRILSGSPQEPDVASRSGLLTPPPILETVKCLWFHGSYLKDKFRAGQRIALYGKLEGSRSGNALNAPPGSTKFKMVQPTFEILPDSSATGEDAEFTTLEMGRIVPVYPSLGGTTPWGAKLTSRWLRRVLWTIFKDLKENQALRENSAGSQQTLETLPHALCERLGLPSRMEALEAVHFPAAGTSMTELMSARTPAHRRLIFEELWYLELGLELKRRRLRERVGTSFTTNDQVRTALKQVLPFKPTSAQKRVLGEIVADMRAPRPMRRLLQGDVGSGKTIVALEAALIAIENGYQVALMAPTEILATQHFLSARKLLANAISPSRGKPYRITLLTGSLDDRAKRDARSRIFRGETDLAIGTHALVEEKVDFANLGLVIVDEQHRFGVQQRFKLMRKPGASGEPTESGAPGGRSSSAGVVEPDVLVMTATPIPRTLALTLYGDLEASVLDELPPGRTPIVTRRMPEERSDEVWDFVRKQVSLGRQAYIVYPIIEGERDDQPELDFAHDEAQEPDQSSASNSAAKKTPSSQSQQASLKSLSSRPKRSRSAREVERPLYFENAGLHNNATKRRALSRAKLRSASEMFDELQLGALAGLKLGLLHGRMSADDKEVTMARFQRGEIQVLIATTVIEVGVDVPNSTVMVVEHADRFGLAQLHQLRGRVGRGAHKSFCVLLTGSKISPEAEQRLDAMVQTQDGFALAEIDLNQRGPGEFFGTRQAGLPGFHVANLTRDRDLLELAKTEAARFVESPDPGTTPAEREAVRTRLKHQWQRRYGLVEA